MKCDFCFRHCEIKEGESGWCKVRTLKGGLIEHNAYGIINGLSADPIEKKPLYHFLPHTSTLSLSMQGCCFDCDFCQNHIVVKGRAGGRRMAAEDVSNLAIRNHFPSVSFTYTEPLVWQDYMLSVAALVKKEGIRTVMVTNGSFSTQALDRILPLMDAFNIDLKGDGRFYREICHAQLQPVLDGIGRVVKEGRHLEVTTMVIEGIHTEEMIAYLGSELHSRGVKVWHLSRFFPHYRMSGREETSEEFLERMLSRAKESGIAHIYPGNSQLPAHLRCEGCGRIIPRGKTCPYCGSEVYGLF